MPNMEHVTKQEVRLSDFAAISTNTTTVGAIFDTANYDLGIYFIFLLLAWTDGAYVLLLEHGDEPAMGDAETVPDANIVNQVDMPTLGAALVEGAAIPRIGVFGTKRYVRASVVSTGTSTGATSLTLIVKDAEQVPVGQP